MGELFEDWPPLKGKIQYEPKGIWDIKWKTLQDAYYSADETPYYILGLTSDNSEDIENASYCLNAATTHQGSVYTASHASIPFLLDIANHGFEKALTFLRRIAIGEEHWYCTPQDKEKIKSIYYDDVVQHLPILLELYEKTKDSDLEFLLSTVPNALPDYLDLEIPTTNDENTDETWAFFNQLIVQGFLAEERKLKDHLPSIRKFSTHKHTRIRQGALICLALSKDATTVEKSELLEYYKEDDPIATLVKRAYCFACNDAELLKANDEDAINELLERHFVPSIFGYTCKETNAIQKEILENMVANNLLPQYLKENYSLPNTITGLKRLLGNTEDQLSKIFKHENFDGGKPMWYLINMFIKGHIENADLVKILRRLPNSWEAISELQDDNGRWTVDYPPINMLSYKNGTCTKLHELTACFAQAMKPHMAKIETYLKDQLSQMPLDWGFGTDNFRMGVALLAFARQGLLKGEFFPLVRPYHSSPKFSRISLYTIAELLTYTSYDYQRKLLKEWDSKQLMQMETKKTIYFSKPIWILLTGCRGQWVTETIQKIAKTYAPLKPNKSSDTFPYKLASQCLKQQEVIDWELIYEVGRL